MIFTKLMRRSLVLTEAMTGPRMDPNEVFLIHREREREMEERRER